VTCADALLVFPVARHPAPSHLSNCSSRLEQDGFDFTSSAPYRYHYASTPTRCASPFKLPNSLLRRLKQRQAYSHCDRFRSRHVSQISVPNHNPALTSPAQRQVNRAPPSTRRLRCLRQRCRSQQANSRRRRQRDHQARSQINSSNRRCLRPRRSPANRQDQRLRAGRPEHNVPSQQLTAHSSSRPFTYLIKTPG
jgi:hypothetical protein